MNLYTLLLDLSQRKIFRQRASSLLEYAMLIAVVTAVLITMQIYLKRGISSKWRQAADNFGYGRLFEPGVTEVK